MAFPVEGWTTKRLVHLYDEPIGKIAQKLRIAFIKQIDVKLKRLHDAHDLINEDSKLDNLGELCEEWLRDKYNANTLY